MILKKVEDINASDLDALVANGVAEGRTIDYKKDLPGNADSDKKEFLADVSSFANTSGGDLLFGVDEQEGLPVGLPGVNVADFDQEIRRLDSIINDGLDPRIRFAIRTINRDPDPSVLIIRVDRSWIGPHRVIFKGHDKFYARNSAGKYPMDVSELRSAFTLASSAVERVREFRENRIAKILQDHTPVPLVGTKGKTILHSIPLESFIGNLKYDVLKYSSQTARIPPMVIGGGWSFRINLDGLVTHSGYQDRSISYTQLFRNGSIEAVEGSWLDTEHAGKRSIPYPLVEGELIKYLTMIFQIQKELGVKPPIVVALSMIGTRGMEMAADVFSTFRGNAIIESSLILPESVVEDFSEPPGKIMKPIFDLIWNACGYAQTKTLDAEGNWVYRR